MNSAVIANTVAGTFLTIFAIVFFVIAWRDKPDSNP